MENTSKTATETKSDHTAFSAGDAVHYSVGGDFYSADVIRVTKTRVFVKARASGEEITFTKRGNGRFVTAGYERGSLWHGHFDRVGSGD